jgi:hypothetical protein
MVHRLVNYVWNNGDINDVVDHKDGNKLNNNKDNLESVSQKENSIRGSGKIVLQYKKRKLVGRYRCAEDALTAIGVKHKFVGCIYRVCKGRRGTYKKFGWSYEKSLLASDDEEKKKELCDFISKSKEESKSESESKEESKSESEEESKSESEEESKSESEEESKSESEEESKSESKEESKSESEEESEEESKSKKE